ncbi:MAG: hypothetical protein Q8891_14695 [Bacteroidota bacterium]|nr:hypothetical protein [Bacteroidota bacterium]
MASGNTLPGFLIMLSESNHGKIMISVTVASGTAVEKLSKEVDEVVAIPIPEIFHGVDAFYEDFDLVRVMRI